MESNGKRVTLEGEVVDHATGPVIWGEPGTNGQHAYFQLLQQGPALIPVDFIVAAESPFADDAQHRILVANCFAQIRNAGAGQDGRRGARRDDRGQEKASRRQNASRRIASFPATGRVRRSWCNASIRSRSGF